MAPKTKTPKFPRPPHEQATHIDVDKQLWRRFKADCSLEGKTLKDGLNDLIREYLTKKKAA